MSERLYKLLEAIERDLIHCAAGPTHPTMLRIFAVRRDGRHLVVQCEKADGIPLSDLLRCQHALAFDNALACLRPLAAAIEHGVENQMPKLDLAVGSIIVEPGDPASVGGPLALKAPPLALSVLNRLRDARQGKTMLFNPLEIDPAMLESESIEQSIASLGALAFELLSGRPAPALKGDYRPIAPLSEAGNLCLRRALEESSSPNGPRSFIEELATGSRCAAHNGICPVHGGPR